MTKVRSLSFLIPAYNDNNSIQTVVDEAKAVGKRVAKRVEIICLDDGSRQPIAARGVRLIRHPVNQGYGRTIKELYYAGKNEWLFTIPGDYQIGAKELETMLRSCNFFLSSPPRIKVRGGDDREATLPDMIVGWRKDRNDPPNRLFVSWAYNTLLRMLFGINLHDINSVRLMRRSVLTDIRLASASAFVDAELVIIALRAGFRVTEVPIAHRPRAGGGRGGGNQWRTIAATIVDMIRFLL